MKTPTSLLHCFFTLLILGSYSQALKAEDQQAEADNKFAFSLYAALSDTPGNLFFSPYSIWSALHMTAGGSSGKTRTEFSQLLNSHLDESDHEAAQQLSRRLVEARGEDATLAIANSLWLQSDYTFLSAFLKLVKQYYEAELHLVDFKTNSQEAREKINDWVEDKTEDKIHDLIGPTDLDTDTRLVLVNAVYFWGKWLNVFRKESTREDEFHPHAGASLQVPFMNQTEHYAYFENDELQAIEVPYQGGDLVMNILLPKARSAEALQKLARYETVQEIFKNLRSSRVILQLPKFNLDASFNLSKTLMGLGARSAFVAGEADFSKMNGNRELSISNVIHKAFINVSEQGTEAAAATAVIMTRAMAAMPTNEPKRFRADHPFLFLIRDRTSSAILFIGRLAQPTT